MHYSIVLFSLITVVASQEIQMRTGEVQNDWVFEYITSALGSTKVAKREASSVFILAGWRSALQRKCTGSDLPASTQTLEVADNSFLSCKNGLKNTLPDNPLTHNTNSTGFTHSLCRFLTEANSCFLDYTEALQPCLPSYKGGNFPFSNISQNVINYLCGDDEAIERSKTFWENAPTCMAEVERTKKCEGGRPYHKLEDTSFMYSEESCCQLAGYWRCVKTELHDCPTSVFDYLEGLAKAVDPIYSPCPIDRTV